MAKLNLCPPQVIESLFGEICRGEALGIGVNLSEVTLCDRSLEKRDRTGVPT